jgi:hypothetical protein
MRDDAQPIGLIVKRLRLRFADAPTAGPDAQGQVPNERDDDAGEHPAAHEDHDPDHPMRSGCEG